VEVLVVLAIIGLLAALILPAVQSSLQASRRAACANNLHQIGLALNAHHEANGHFPHGIRPNGMMPGGHLFAGPSPLSAHSQLLPYLEQSSLYNSINIFTGLAFGTDIPTIANGPENRTSSDVSLTVFLCPSDARVREGTNYRACTGPAPFIHDGKQPPGGGGVFPGLASTSARDLLDGSSHTAGFGERVQGWGASGDFNPGRDIWFSGVIELSRPSDADDMRDACGVTLTATPKFWPTSGSRWAIGGLADTLYNHVAPPNWTSADCSAGTEVLSGSAVTGGAVSARSGHPGGVNLLLMDGSVRFVKQSIAVPTWRALASRNGRDSVDDIP